MVLSGLCLIRNGVTPAAIEKCHDRGASERPKSRPPREPCSGLSAFETARCSQRNQRIVDRLGNSNLRVCRFHAALNGRDVGAEAAIHAIYQKVCSVKVRSASGLKQL